MTRFPNFGSWGAHRTDLHMKPPSTMGHECLIQRRPSLSPLAWLKYFFSDIQSVTLNYHTPRHIYVLWEGLEAQQTGLQLSVLYLQWFSCQ